MTANLFSGIKVLELTSNLAGPFAGALMADFGAEIIKIEQPGAGDSSRGFNPQVDGVSTMFMFLNRGKKSVELDIKTPEGLNAVKKLVKWADIVIECNKPGMMEKFGLGYDDLKALKPDVIMCRISAFGQTGPDKDRPGHDLMAQAESGAMDVTGDADSQPMKHGFALSAYAAATYAFGAISAALFHRERTAKAAGSAGEGQCIDISLMDSLFSMNDYVEPAALGINAARTGNNHTLLAPFGLFTGNGGSIAIAALTPKAWGSLCKLTGRTDMIDDERFKTAGKRMDNIYAVNSMIEAWLRSFGDMGEPERLLKAAGIPCAKINSAKDLLTNEQLIARDMVVTSVTHAGTPIVTRGNPVKFAGESFKAIIGRPPAQGEHTKEVMDMLKDF